MTDPAPTDTASSPTQHLWLVKTEPEEFSWETLRARGPSCWDGVRNVEARNGTCGACRWAIPCSSITPARSVLSLGSRAW